MTTVHKLFVRPTGTVEHLYDDALSEIFQSRRKSITRASNVEPGYQGWYVDLSRYGHESLGPFHLRSQAIAAEVEWLERELRKGGLE